MLERLEEHLGNNPLTGTIRNILACNWIVINDNTSYSKDIVQTNGVLQGDPLSPLLFNIATSKLIEEIKDKDDDAIKVYMYADDTVLASTDFQKLQEAFIKLIIWAKENDFEINMLKTVQMTFRKGGRVSNKEKITDQNGEVLNNVNKFKYLGMTLQIQGRNFTVHVKERVAAAVAAMSNINLLNRHSIKTALQLFKLMITPIIAYGLELIWEHLSKRNLAALERVKSIYLKKALCLSKYSLSRLTYEMVKEPFYIEDLRLEMLLPSTTAYNELIEELQMKKNDIWMDFYTTEAMTNADWMEADYDLRHTVTRFAVHGFHHRICSVNGFHEPDGNCVCNLCGHRCDRYHVFNCAERKSSLTKFCSE